MKDWTLADLGIGADVVADIQRIEDRDFKWLVDQVLNFSISIDQAFEYSGDPESQDLYEQLCKAGLNKSVEHYLSLNGYSRQTKETV
jgi:hypothetical protein